MRELSYSLAVGGSVLVAVVFFTDIEMIRAIYGLLAAQCLISVATYLLLLGKVRSE